MGVIDLTTLKPLECKLSPNVAGKMRGHLGLRGSADGRTFGCWEPLTIPSGLFVLHFANEKLDGTYQRSVAHIRLSRRFRRACLHGPGNLRQPRKAERSQREQQQARISYLPAVGGPAYLTYPCEMKSRSPAPRTSKRSTPATPPRDSSKATASVYQQGYPDPLAKIQIEGVPNVVVPNQQKRDGLTIDKRLVFLAAAGALVTIPEPRDTVVVRPLDIEAELHRAGKDFLMVLSVPPRSMALGETLAYQIDARSSGGNIKYKLESGPEGMTVSDDGLVQWTPASRPPDGAATGVVSVAAGTRAVKLR